MTRKTAKRHLNARYNLKRPVKFKSSVRVLPMQLLERDTIVNTRNVLAGVVSERPRTGKKTEINVIIHTYFFFLIVSSFVIL